MPLKALGGCQFARGCTKPYTIPRDHVVVLTNRAIYIKQMPKMSVLPSMESKLPLPGFWIRTFPSVSGIYISNVQPAECWDPKSRIVRSPNLSTSEVNWQVSLTVAFETNDRGHRTIVMGCSNGYPYIRLLPDATNISKRTIEGAFCATRESSYSLGLDITTTEQKVLAMGLPVRIVDIRLVPMYETGVVQEVAHNKLFS